MDRETALEIHELHARLCKAIADPKRLLIINELRDGPLTVGELAEALGFTASKDFTEGLAELSAWVARQSAEDHVERARRELEQRGLVA